MTQIDWRLPENRREGFQRFYSFHLRYKSHPGCVYALLPAIADGLSLDNDQRAWLVWLNGNTQNVVTSLMLLEAAPRPTDWKRAVDFWSTHFKLLEWDTDRRHQKNRFGEATEDWFLMNGRAPADEWISHASSWSSIWRYAFAQPHMGRLSAWSMIEYARILLGPSIPDADTWLLHDKSGSRSHRNGIAVVKGYDATYWDAEVPFMLGIVEDLEAFADELLDEAEDRNNVYEWANDVGRLTMESALCTYKSWHKPNRRYPNVYADMMYNRIKKAEARFGRTFDLLWRARRQHLPEWLRLEDNLRDPGLSPVKQNHYLETGQIPVLATEYDDMDLSDFDVKVVRGEFGERKDPKWTS